MEENNILVSAALPTCCNGLQNIPPKSVPSTKQRSPVTLEKLPLGTIPFYYHPLSTWPAKLRSSLPTFRVSGEVTDTLRSELDALFRWEHGISGCATSPTTLSLCLTLAPTGWGTTPRTWWSIGWTHWGPRQRRRGDSEDHCGVIHPGTYAGATSPAPSKNARPWEAARWVSECYRQARKR